MDISMEKIPRRIPRWLMALGISGAVLFTAQSVQAAPITEQTRIEEGVYIHGIDMGGKTVTEACNILEDEMKKIAASPLTVTYGEETAQMPLEFLDLSWDSKAAAEEAAAYGKSGSLIFRYKEQTDLKYTNAEVALPYTYNRSAITEFITTDVASHDTEAVNASIYREDGEFTITPEVTGIATDIEKTVDAICNTLDESLTENVIVESIAAIAQPDITAEMLGTIQDRLGTYSTDYSSSSYNRKTNIKVASGRINGTLLMPGESISVDQKILSRNEENGYMLAPQYTNGVTEDSYGGGVCQVSTTLYNAVLRAELQIDQRSPHSMVVHYVPYASDAAIAEGNKDFVFTNDTEGPIYIAASADGETLTFSIYGKETRPENRTIEFVSNTLHESTPDPVVEYTDEHEVGYESVSGSTSPEVSATLTKIVYIDGEEESRTLLHTDHYSGRAKTILKGTREPEPETEPETTSPPETEPAYHEPETTSPPQTEPEEEEEEVIDPPEPDEEEDE